MSETYTPSEDSPDEATIDYTPYSPENAPINTRFDTEDGNVAGVTLDPRATAHMSSWQPKYDIAQGQAQADSLEQVAGQVTPSFIDPLDTIMRIEGAEGEAYDALRQAVVNLVVKGDILRTALEVLAFTHTEAKNARDQFVRTPHLLREEPYMNEVWYRAGTFSASSTGIVEQIEDAEGVITSVTYTPVWQGEPLAGEVRTGSFEDLRNMHIPLPVASGYNNIFRSAEQEYQEVFHEIESQISRTVSVQHVGQKSVGDATVTAQLHTSTLTSEKARLWGLRDSDLQGENANLIAHTTVDKGVAYDTHDETDTLSHTVSEATQQWTSEQQKSAPSPSSPAPAEPATAPSMPAATYTAPAVSTFAGGGLSVPAAPTPTVPSTSSTATGAKLSPEIQELLDKLEVVDEKDTSSKSSEREIPEGATPIKNAEGEIIGYIPAEERSEQPQAQYGYYDPSTGKFMPQTEPGAYDSERGRWVTVDEQRREFERAQAQTPTPAPQVTETQGDVKTTKSNDEKLVQFASEDDELPELND